MCCVYSKYTYVLHHTCLYPAKNRLYSDLYYTTAFSCYLLKRRKLVIGENKAFLLDKALAFEGATTQVSWDNVTGKPDSYPPETHTHDMVQVTGLEDELSSMQSAIANKANTEHTHEIADVTNLQTQLNGKASTSHTHTIANITNLQTTLNGKAASSHNHSASNITSGTLPTSRGGTGITANPSMLINLGSTSAASVFQTSPRPGVTGTLPVARGGTGVTSLEALKSSLNIATKPSDAYYVKYKIISGTCSANSPSQSKTISGITEDDIIIIINSEYSSIGLSNTWCACSVSGDGQVNQGVLSSYYSKRTCKFYTFVYNDNDGRNSIGRTLETDDNVNKSYHVADLKHQGTYLQLTTYRGPTNKFADFYALILILTNG